MHKFYGQMSLCSCHVGQFFYSETRPNNPRLTEHLVEYYIFDHSNKSAVDQMRRDPRADKHEPWSPIDRRLQYCVTNPIWSRSKWIVVCCTHQKVTDLVQCHLESLFCHSWCIFFISTKPKAFYFEKILTSRNWMRCKKDFHIVISRVKGYLFLGNSIAALSERSEKNELAKPGWASSAQQSLAQNKFVATMSAITSASMSAICI